MLFQILCCPTNELKDYSNKSAKQKFVQKQPQEVFFEKRCSLKFGKIHRKTPASSFFFNKVKIDPDPGIFL